MTINAFLNRLDRVRRSGRGWTACCPAHGDRHPSLSVSEGGRAILVKCWSQECKPEEITAALGLTMRDLFYDADVSVTSRPPRRPKPLDLRTISAKLKLHGDMLWLRGHEVLDAGKHLDTSDWSDKDWDAAMDAIEDAYRDLERSEMFEQLAFNVRCRELARRQSGAAA